MPAATFTKTSPAPLAFDKALGLCFGWFCFSKKDGAEYDDLHGDHAPDDELVKAVDKLMAKPAAEREINVEHAGGARGSIATAQALTEDVAKALGIDTGGNYGVVGSFRPDAALMKRIDAGDIFCLSIEGNAQVEVIAKSADAAEVAKARKRILRNIDLTKLAVVKAGAHEGASVALIKTARAAVTARIAKACPAMTSPTNGHAHLIADCDEDAGYTSSEPMSGQPDSGWHSHPWLKDEATGAITIGEALGHSHTVNPTDDTAETDMPTADETVAKSLHTAEIAKRDARLATILALSNDERAFAKRLQGAALDAFLDASAADRTARAAPIHKSERTGRVFFAGDEALVEIVKDADEQAAKFAKSEAAGHAVAFEKRAEAELKHVPGTVDARAFILKAIDATPGGDEVKKAALAVLTAADKSFATVFKTVGVGGNADPVVKTAQEELDGITAEIAKAQGVTFAKASDLALDTPRGRQLYNEIERAKRNA